MKRLQYLAGAIFLLIVLVFAIIYPVVAKIACGAIAFILICFIWIVLRDQSEDYF